MIVELPFTYQVIGVPPRCKNSRQLIQVDTVSVDIPQSLGLELPVVVEWQEQIAGKCQSMHLRYASGKFYAPVRSSGGEGFRCVDSGSVQDLVRCQAEEVNGWLSVLPGGAEGLPTRDAMAEWFYTGTYSNNIDMGAGLRKSTWGEEHSRSHEFARRLRLINDVFYVECDEPKLVIWRHAIDSQVNAWSSSVSIRDLDLELTAPWGAKVFPMCDFDEFREACGGEAGLQLDHVLSVRLLDPSIFEADLLGFHAKRIAHQLTMKLHSFKRWLPQDVVRELEKIEGMMAGECDGTNAVELLRSLETFMPYVRDIFDEELRHNLESGISELGSHNDNREIRISPKDRGLLI